MLAGGAVETAAPGAGPPATRCHGAQAWLPVSAQVWRRGTLQLHCVAARDNVYKNGIIQNDSSRYRDMSNWDFAMGEKLRSLPNTTWASGNLQPRSSVGGSARKMTKRNKAGSD